MSEDITFCMNRKCGYLKCECNPKHIKHFEKPHSFAYYENTEVCHKKKNNVGNRKVSLQSKIDK